MVSGSICSEGLDASVTTGRRVVPSFCRACHHYCPINITIEDGMAVQVTGNKANDVYDGYTCVKGRAWPALINHADRLHRSLKRGPNGHETIAALQALDEIAERVARIVETHGPESVAMYLGTHAIIGNSATVSVAHAFADALGITMRFSPLTIDQPGKTLAKLFHGTWQAPAVPFAEASVALFIGVNPLVSHWPALGGSPGKRFAEAKARGAKFIVIDPRRTDTARRAFLHLQPRPGQDVPILAAMIRTILDENLHDHHFVSENVAGLDALRAAVALFSAEEAGERAGVSATDIVLAARTFASDGPSWGFAGTGPSMAQSSTLVEYLLLCLKSICGNWKRAGDRVPNPGALLPQFPAVAQAAPPGPWRSEATMRGLGLPISVVEPPVSAAAAEMLIEGEGRIRALISVGGNPVVAWPDQHRTIAGLQNLDLLVQIDPWLSQTARMADYVIAPTMGPEVPGMTQLIDTFESRGDHGFTDPYGQYTPAIVEHPAGSDLIEEWQFFYGIAQRLGIELVLRPRLPGGVKRGETVATRIDMSNPPTTDDLLEMLASGSRIPLPTVKAKPEGGSFPGPAVLVAPKEEGWDGMLQVGDREMLADLAEQARRSSAPDDQYPFHLISRRMMQVYNSSSQDPSSTKGRSHNPAYMNPNDLFQLGVQASDLVEIGSAHGTIVGIVESDESVREGCVAMAHCFGDVPELDSPIEHGSPTSRLSTVSQVNEPYSGQPLMSGIPVTVAKHHRTADRT